MLDNLLDAKVAEHQRIELAMKELDSLKVDINKILTNINCAESNLCKNQMDFQTNNLIMQGNPYGAA